jgi:hypothetical protein
VHGVGVLELEEAIPRDQLLGLLLEEKDKAMSDHGVGVGDVSV